MESLVLVALLAALLAVLHAAVAAYLYRSTLERDGRRSTGEATADERGMPPVDGHPDEAVETTACSTCGAPNDPSYRFCRRCVADLSGGGATADGVAVGRLGS
jgi:hypothetical protein